MKHSDYQPLEGQVALVTGASSGIGMGVAKALALASIQVNWVDSSPAHRNPSIPMSIAHNSVRVVR